MRSLFLPLLASCVGTPLDTGEEPVEPSLFLGVCDAWDVNALEGGITDLETKTADVQALAGHGVHLVRPHRPAGHVFAMNLVVRGTGPWDWTLPDYVVATSGEADVHLMATLQPYTEVRDDPRMAPFVVPVGDLPVWADFVEQIVERYDGDGVADMPGLVHPVLAWEVANEPRCDLDDEACLSAYALTVRTAWEAAHEAHPEVDLMVGGALPPFSAETGEHKPKDTVVYEYFFDHGGEAWTDAMPIHLTTGTAFPPVEDYLDLWAELAPEQLPVWITESGPYSPVGEMTHDDPAEAAAWYLTQLDVAREAGVEHMLWCLAQRDLDERPELLEALAGYQSSP